MDQPIESTADELPPGDPADLPPDDPPRPSTAIVPTRRHEVLTPLDVTQQAAAMRLYQDGLRSILDTTDWQNAGGNEKFVKKSGWRKIAAWFDLSIEFVRDVVERDEGGAPARAQVVARAIAPSGRYADGDGYCDVSESRFNRNKGKLENDLRGTATTRAVNRAISNLVGMGAVSAEEVDTPPGRPWGPEADQVQIQRFTAGLTYLFNPDGEGDADQVADLVGQVFARIAKEFGYGPAAAVQGVMHVAAVMKAALEGGQQPAEPTTPKEATDGQQ